MIASANMSSLGMFFLLLLVLSRGVLELYVPGSLVYVIQFLALIGILFLIVSLSPAGFVTKGDVFLWYILIFFCLLALLAAVLSGFNMSPVQGLVVNFVNVFNFSFLIIAYQLIYFVKIKVPKINLILFVLGLYVSTTAYLQLNGVVEFAGTAEFGELVRVSGAPGSKQHLSLVLAIFSVYFLHRFYQDRTIPMFIAFIYVLFSLFVTYTRVGYVFFLIVVILWFVFQGYYNRFFVSVKLIFLCVMLLLVVLFLMSLIMPVAFEAFISRMTMIDTGEYSNQIRLNAWLEGFSYFFDGCIVVSCDAGMASQIPGKLFAVFVPHYENGHIQVMINFGIIGWLLLMMLFCYPFFRVWRPREFSIMVASSICLFFYMFNEIVPVFVLLSLVLIAMFDDRVVKAGSVK